VNFDRVFDLLRALEPERVECVLVGGVAVNLQGVTRATEVMDIAVRLQEDNIERLKRGLHRVWNDPRIDEINYKDLAGNYPAIA
jgi:hypothetical protein